MNLETASHTETENLLQSLESSNRTGQLSFFGTTGLLGQVQIRSGRIVGLGSDNLGMTARVLQRLTKAGWVPTHWNVSTLSLRDLGQDLLNQGIPGSFPESVLKRAIKAEFLDALHNLPWAETLKFDPQSELRVDESMPEISIGDFLRERREAQNIFGKFDEHFTARTQVVIAGSMTQAGPQGAEALLALSGQAMSLEELSDRSLLSRLQFVEALLELHALGIARIREFSQGDLLHRTEDFIDETLLKEDVDEFLDKRNLGLNSESCMVEPVTVLGSGAAKVNANPSVALEIETTPVQTELRPGFFLSFKRTGNILERFNSYLLQATWMPWLVVLALIAGLIMIPSKFWSPVWSQFIIGN